MFFNKNKKIKDFSIIIISSILIIGIYIYTINTKKNQIFMNEDSYLIKINNNDDIDNGKLPQDMDKKFNNDYKQFLSNNDIISSEIKKLEKDISEEEKINKVNKIK